ncbi:MAG: recombinase family protein [Collinsella sp.]
MSENKLAVIYARFSSSSQREESIEGQLKACYDYAKREGYSVVGEDRPIQMTRKYRPDFQRMIIFKRKTLLCVMVTN